MKFTPKFFVMSYVRLVQVRSHRSQNIEADRLRNEVICADFEKSKKNTGQH